MHIHTYSMCVHNTYWYCHWITFSGTPSVSFSASNTYLWVWESEVWEFNKGMRLVLSAIHCHQSEVWQCNKRMRLVLSAIHCILLAMRLIGRWTGGEMRLMRISLSGGHWSRKCMTWGRRRWSSICITLSDWLWDGGDKGWGWESFIAARARWVLGSLVVVCLWGMYMYMCV